MTGAAGRIGRALRGAIGEAVRELRLLDLESSPGGVESVDLADRRSLEESFVGAHGVVHLGGVSDEADIVDLVTANVLGTANVLEAARRAGVRRVVLASSNRITGMYPVSEFLRPSCPPRPDGFYGWSKVGVEALGRLYADKFGLDVVCVRIGSFERAPTESRHLSTWLSPADALAALLAAMGTDRIENRYAVFYAVSANRHRWWDLGAGRRLGFDPVDDAADERPDLVAVTDGPQAGRFAAADFSLRAQRGR